VQLLVDEARKQAHVVGADVDGAEDLELVGADQDLRPELLQRRCGALQRRVVVIAAAAAAGLSGVHVVQTMLVEFCTGGDLLYRLGRMVDYLQLVDHFVQVRIRTVGFFSRISCRSVHGVIVARICIIV